MTKTDQFQESLTAFCQDVGAREATRSDAMSDALQTMTHPFVASDLAAAQLHQRMFMIQLAMNKNASSVTTHINYPIPGVVTLTRGLRSVSLRHWISDCYLHIGSTDSPQTPLQEHPINPQQVGDLDLIARRMSEFLAGTSATLFPLSHVQPAGNVVPIKP